MSESVSNPKIAFVVGRPSGHPLHMAYAHSVNADIVHEDRILRWLDIPSAGKLRRYVSWILNAFFFPKRSEYDMIICECLRVPPLIMKYLGLLSKKQKLVALMSDESLYFLDKGKYPRVTQWLVRFFLKNCDHIICIESLQYELALKHTSKQNPSKVHLIPNGIPEELLGNLLESPIRKGPIRKMVFVANISSQWRAWYKGLDLALKAFDTYSKEYDLTMDIIGHVEQEVKADLLKMTSDQSTRRINFIGSVSDMGKVIGNYDLCIHPSRGDAGPLSVLECYAAGIPAVISNVTGMKSHMQKLDPAMICDTTDESVSSSLKHILEMSPESRMKLSEKLKDSVKNCTLDASIKSFKETVWEIYDVS
jgi:glycosyltransferase involved in cell wall biosynthesis